MAGSEGDAGLRRAPRQARSQALVERVYQAAEEIIRKDGVDALTTHRVAEEAEIAIGSVYQYFTDRQAIIDGIGRRYMASNEAVMLDLVGRVAFRSWTDLVDMLIDMYVSVYRSEDVYRALWLGHQLSPSVNAANEASNDEIAVALAALIAANEGLAEVVAGDPAFVMSCRVGVQIAESVLRLAFRDSDTGDLAMVEELKRIERHYLAEVVRRWRPVPPA